MPAADYADTIVHRIKSWWKSKTVWLGSMLVAIAGLGEVLPLFSHYLVDPTIKQWVYSAIGVAIVVNRIFFTNQAVTVRAAEKPVAADRLVPSSNQNRDFPS